MRSPILLTAVALAAAALAVGIACARSGASQPGPSAAGPSAAGSPVVVVGGATAKALVEQGARVVDVRTPAEFAAGHVPGAVNVPYDEIERRAGELGAKETPLLLYCRSGRRSGIAGEALHRLGFTRVSDLKRFTDWPGPVEQ